MTACRKERTSFVNYSIQLARHTRNMFLQSSMVKNTPQFSVIMHMSRIEIITNCAFKQGGILRDNGKSASQVKQAYGGDIETVDTSIASQYASVSPGTREISYLMEPAMGSMMRNNASVKELLPAPVRPTTPIFSWGLMSREISRNTGSRPSR